MAFRSFRSGRSTCISRSNRPARSKALSSMSTRLVAARIMTPLFVPNPSISVSRALSVRTRDAPTPTNISTKSEPLIEKKGTPASPATALARRVLPVPGGPTRRAPLGILPPKSVYLLGFFRKSTISCTSCLAPSCPATSLKVMPMALPFSYIRALLLPTLKIPPPEPPMPPIRPDIHQMKTKKRISGKIFHKILRKPSVDSFL